MSTHCALPDHPFTATDLPALGISRSQLRTMVAEGDVRRVLRGVYAPAHLPDDLATRAACAALILPPHVVVCDLGAAWILGVQCHEAAALDIAPPLDVVSIGGHDRSRRPELLGGKRSLVAGDLVEIGGVLLTSPIRTACDVACLRGRRRAMAALDGFARAYQLTQDDFARILPRYRGRRGCRQLRELVGYLDPRAESPRESWLRLEIIDAGLPAPQAQVWVTLPGWGRVRLDLAYEHLRIAIEYDGEEFHGEDQAANDRARREALRRAGWIVLVVRKEDFSTDASLRWTAQLRELVTERRTPTRRRYPAGQAFVR